MNHLRVAQPRLGRQWRPKPHVAHKRRQRPPASFLEVINRLSLVRTTADRHHAHHYDEIIMMPKQQRSQSRCWPQPCNSPRGRNQYQAG